MTEDQNEKVTKIMRSVKVAMLTQVDVDGRLVAHPMATQEAEFDGTVRFIAERKSAAAQNLAADPRVNVSYSGNGSWLSLSGTARVVNDEAKLKELWSGFTGAWLEGGPENPDNILIEVTGNTAEYWDAPGGSKVVQLANLVKSAVKKERIEGDNQVVDL